MKSKVRWVLVANTSLARILRDLPDTGVPSRPELVLRAPHNRLRNLMAGAPDRSPMSGDGPEASSKRRGATLITEDDREFVRQIVALLQTHRRAGDFETLTLVASAPMLGLLRAAMPGGLRAVIDCEIAKNYVRIASCDLPGIIRREMDRLDGGIS